MDLQEYPPFQSLDVKLLSLSPDSADVWQQEAAIWGISTPVLPDRDNQVAHMYGVMRWATPGGEPGHTFILVDDQGKVRWVQDYGAPENGGLMYVEPEHLTTELALHLE